VTIRVGVFGAEGRMGRTVCDAVAGDPELELVARMDVGDERDSSIDVAVDFTAASAARENAAWCAEHGVHAVIGTSGITDDDVASFRAQFTSSNCLVAPNFAIGAVLMVRLSELAAPYFDTVEILEQHHDGKIDAPSGTAVHTAERIAAVKAEWAADPTQKETIAGARGSLGPAGIHVHSMRLRGIIASQEVVFGTTGQTLQIRHDTFDRTSFMPGVLLATKRIADHPGVTVGLDQYLGI
jgi:4-hydroxy-tetrahydrodipicolinate reductase